MLPSHAQQQPPKPDTPPPPAPDTNTRRLELNLLGKTDTAAGESRRNENIQFNLVDNNALKELNIRLGATATIIEVFRPERSYFSSEFGNAPGAVLYLPPTNRGAVHGTLFESHRNSIFSARSFFQVGGVEPAHENDYGFTFSRPSWRGADILLEGGQPACAAASTATRSCPCPTSALRSRPTPPPAPSSRAFSPPIPPSCPIAPTSIRAPSTPTRPRPSTTITAASASARS